MKKSYTHLLLAHNNTWYNLPLQDILYFKTDTKHITFYALGRTPIQVLRNAKQYTTVLLHLHFVQIFKGTAINVNHVQQIQKLQYDYEVLLTSNIRLGLSRSRRTELINRLKLNCITNATKTLESYHEGYPLLLH